MTTAFSKKGDCCTETRRPVDETFDSVGLSTWTEDLIEVMSNDAYNPPYPSDPRMV